MKKTAFICLLIILLVACKVPYTEKGTKGMNQNNKTQLALDTASINKLFDRWDKVWRDGQYELMSSCVTPNYIRHDLQGDRIITRDDYAKEIKKIRTAYPDIQFLIHDRSIDADRVWIRYTLKYTDPKTGKIVNQKGMQEYRIDQGKLTETWLVLQDAGTEWPEITH